GIGITIFYQGFFLLFGAVQLVGVILLNFLFMGGYAAVIALNAAQRHDLARHLGVGIVLTHILAIAYIMSAGIGAHLFYIPLAGMLVLLYPRDDWRDLLGLFAVPLLLCLVSQFFFLDG